MEVGAVKQAFNNEVIQLKRNLNQAKIQIIHKLTRKAKTFAEKKAPEKLKEKLKRKAESAVNEVLILKKIKPRDVARFTVTHTGNLQEYLNKPIVDQDKACARLLLHKSLQEKYNTIRNTFNNIPIKDLLMSRNERLKLKREALLDKKMKRDKKKKVVNAAGEWDVENINTSKTKDVKQNIRKKIAGSESEGDEEMEFVEKDESGDEANSNDDEARLDAEKASSDDQNDEKGEGEGQSDESDAEAKIETDQESDDNEEQSDNEEEEQSDSEEEEQSKDEEEEQSKDDEEEEESHIEQKETNEKAKRSKIVKPSPVKPDIEEVKNVSSAITFDQLGKNRRKPEIKKPNKPKDMHKNKNLKEKLQSRKFKKDLNESQVKETKIVDPFFITATGENYMSVAEPRQPDEVKEIHKQGNRKERRAVMFGHAPKVKPRQDFRNNSSTQNHSNGFRRKNQSGDGSYNKGNDGFRNRNDSKFRGKNDEFRSRNDRSFEGGNNQFRGRNDKPFEARNNQFKGQNDRPVEGRNDQFKGRNDSKFKGRSNDAGEPKVEKLHPSWEAKKKQSGILPFQGKKIVFDEG